ncbi:MAG: hypothetical protein ACLQED_08450 [Desulfobaccales bacterium]|jgi:hypothetical protein
MEDSMTSPLSRRECLLLQLDFLADLLFLLSSLCVLEDVGFFLTVFVGSENARLGEKVSARVITMLTIIRFAIQNLLGDETIRRGLAGSSAPDNWHL